MYRCLSRFLPSNHFTESLCGWETVLFAWQFGDSGIYETWHALNQMSRLFNLRESLLIWIAALQYRHYEITANAANAADSKVIWEEQDSQDSPRSNLKCDKVTFHLISNTPTGEEKLVTITVFVTKQQESSCKERNSKNGARIQVPNVAWQCLFPKREKTSLCLFSYSRWRPLSI